MNITDKIREQYNNQPYPRFPLEQTPKYDIKTLYYHNLTTAYYQRYQQVIDSENKVILDAGCGSGYTSLTLAEANPRAKIIGIDLSEKSIEIAQERLKYHGFNQAEFYVLSIEDLPKLNIKFDYINCDETLYFLPDPLQGLKSMRSVLQPEGIIKGNLHNSTQRIHYYHAQQLFKMMGLFDNNPEDFAIEVVRETIKALKDHVFHKAMIWKPEFETDDQRILMNYLIQGDQGYTISQMFKMIKTAGLEFISMVNWRKWELINLFKNVDELPIFLAMTLAETSLEDRLSMYEYLHPVHRLLDFWCGHPQPETESTSLPVTDWEDQQWQKTTVYLHPQLQTAEFHAEIVTSIQQRSNLELTKYLSLDDKYIYVDDLISACLLRLWEKSLLMTDLVQLWQNIRPLNPLTLEQTTIEEAFTVIRDELTYLEGAGYILLQN
jgi:ubiquinone/menaquinone biosynthesis C-methylase UbiE